MECIRATLNLLNEGRLNLAAAICIRYVLGARIDKSILYSHIEHHPYFLELKQIIDIVIEE